jgi:hypothetical protein
MLERARLPTRFSRREWAELLRSFDTRDKFSEIWREFAQEADEILKARCEPHVS